MKFYFVEWLTNHVSENIHNSVTFSTAFNPKGSQYSRQKYKKKMEKFVERCELITYLSAKMTRKYKEPQFRAIDFDHKLQAFFSLRNIDPVTG